MDRGLSRGKAVSFSSRNGHHEQHAYPARVGTSHARRTPVGQQGSEREFHKLSASRRPVVPTYNHGRVTAWSEPTCFFLVSWARAPDVGQEHAPLVPLQPVRQQLPQGRQDLPQVSIPDDPNPRFDVVYCLHDVREARAAGNEKRQKGAVGLNSPPRFDTFSCLITHAHRPSFLTPASRLFCL